MKLGMMLEVDETFTTIWLSRSRWGDDLSPLWGLFFAVAFSHGSVLLWRRCDTLCNVLPVSLYGWCHVFIKWGQWQNQARCYIQKSLLGGGNSWTSDDCNL